MPEILKADDLIDKSVAKRLKEIGDETKKIIASFDGVLKSSKSLDEQFKKSDNTNKNVSKSLQTVTTNLNTLSKSELEAQKLEQKTAEILAKTTIEKSKQGKEYQKANIQRQEQNKAIREEIQLQKSQEGSINRLTAANKKLLAERNKLNPAIEKNKLRINEINKEIDRNNTKIKENKSLLEKQKDNVGNYGSAFGKLKNILAGFGLVLGGATIAMKVFHGIIDATQTIGDAFRRKIEEAKASTELFFRAIATGDFSNFISRLKEVVKVAGEYADILDRLGDLNRSLDVEREKENKRLSQLRLIYADVSKSNKERLDAANEYIDIVGRLSKKGLDYAKEEYDITVKNAATQIGVSEEVIKRLAEQYDGIEDLLKQGKEYNALVKKRKIIEYDLFSGIVRTTKQSQELKSRLESVSQELINMGDSAKAAGEIQAKYQSSNDKLLQKVADSAKKYYQADYAYENDIRRAVSARGTVLVSINAENERAAAKIKKLDKDVLNFQISNLNKLNDEKIDNLDNFDKEYLSSLKKQVDAELETSTEKLKIWGDETVKRIELEKQVSDKRKELHKEIVKDTADLADAILERKISKVEEEFQLENEMLTEKREKELKAAGDDADKKSKIEEKYKKIQLEQEKKQQKEIGKLKRRQAILDKAVRLFDIITQTAKGIVTYLSNPVTAPLVPLVIATGAIQSAAVIAQPIPQFAKGVKDFAGGEAIVGEEGYELIKYPNGQAVLTPNQATKMILPKGSDVITHEESEKILKESLSSEAIERLNKEQRLTRKAIENLRIDSTIITARGFQRMQRSGNTITNRIDKWFR